MLLESTSCKERSLSSIGYTLTNPVEVSHNDWIKSNVAWYVPFLKWKVEYLGSGGFAAVLSTLCFGDPGSFYWTKQIHITNKCYAEQ